MTVDRRVRAPTQDGGRVVPNYAFTAGRTRSTRTEMPIEALVTVTELGLARYPDLAPEYRTIISACGEPRSLMEIGAILEVPVGVARVLVSDLAGDEYLAVHLPLVGADGRPRRELLERLLDGLRAR